MSYYNDVYDKTEAAIKELAEFRLDNALPVTTDAMRDDVRDYRAAMDASEAVPLMRAAVRAWYPCFPEEVAEMNVARLVSAYNELES